MDILTVPAISSLVFTLIESISGIIPSKVKPPLALLLGAAWAMAARHSIPGSFDNDLSAIAIGMTAGAAASGIASFRTTYQLPEVVEKREVSTVTTKTSEVAAMNAGIPK